MQPRGSPFHPSRSTQLCERMEASPAARFAACSRPSAMGVKTVDRGRNRTQSCRTRAAGCEGPRSNEMSTSATIVEYRSLLASSQ